ncbi:MAG: class I SAM-dependent methyltransferase [Candidatus Thiodiazotropha sp.]
MENKLISKIRKIPQFIKNYGIDNFALYLITAPLLSIVSLLLTPIKKKVDKDPFYHVFNRFTATVNEMPHAKLLEIGSRNVTGEVRRDIFQSTVDYTGLDIHAGENVDVVADVHELSAHLPENHYDAVFSISVFEHLAMPWQVVIEINRVMKPGGLLFIATHPVIPAHELPWDFWRYSSETFKVLLNQRTGFEILESVEGTPARILSLSRDRTTSKVHLIPVHQSIGVLARKIDVPDAALAWKLPVSNLLQSQYPNG